MDDTLKPNDKFSDNEGHRERVRSAMVNNPDLSSFADYQLLEYLLFYTIPRQDTKPLAKELIRRYGTLAAVLGTSCQELQRVPGVGEKTAHFLAFVARIVIRAESSKYNRPLKICTKSDVGEYLRSKFLGCGKEILFLTSVNINDEVIQTDLVAEGGVDSAPVDLNKIMRIADRNGAKKLILSHNHPGGTLSFSSADIKSTARVLECCTLLGYTFVDHFIFVGYDYLSMFDNDLLVAALEECGKDFAKIRDSFSQETSRRKANILKLGESDYAEEESIHKMRMLEGWNEFQSLDESKRDSIMRSILRNRR